MFKAHEKGCFDEHDASTTPCFILDSDGLCAKCHADHASDEDCLTEGDIDQSFRDDSIER